MRQHFQCHPCPVSLMDQLRTEHGGRAWDRNLLGRELLAAAAWQRQLERLNRQMRSARVCSISTQSPGWSRALWSLAGLRPSLLAWGEGKRGDFPCRRCGCWRLTDGKPLGSFPSPPWDGGVCRLWIPGICASVAEMAGFTLDLLELRG